MIYIFNRWKFKWKSLKARKMLWAKNEKGNGVCRVLRPISIEEKITSELQKRNACKLVHCLSKINSRNHLWWNELQFIMIMESGPWLFLTKLVLQPLSWQKWKSHSFYYCFTVLITVKNAVKALFWYIFVNALNLYDEQKNT